MLCSSVIYAQKTVTFYNGETGNVKEKQTNSNNGNSSAAQQNVDSHKEILYVDYFEKSRDLPVTYMQIAKDQVINGLIKRGRVTVIDGENYYTGRFNARSTEDVIRESGARYVIWGSLGGYEYKKTPQKRGGWDCNVYMNLVLCGQDLKAGTAFEPYSIRISGYGHSLDEADAKALESICNRVDYFVEKYCKFETKVIQVFQPDDKGRVDLYISAGTSMGVKNTDQFDLYVERDIQGHKARTKIATVTVRGVEGPTISLARSRRNQGTAIADAFNSGNTVIAVSAGESIF